MRYKYEFKTGVTRIRTKLAIALSVLALGVGGIIGSLAIFGAAHADSSNINFESGYSTGNVDGQHGWSKAGPYDVAVVPNSYGYSTFGTQSLRISDAVTSGSFGDQTFAPSLTQPAGEADAIDINGLPVTSPQAHFEAQFDIASTTKAEQTGMHMSVSPDRGDGARMSYLRFEDSANAINVFFDDVTDPTHTTNAATFNETQVATLSYDSVHTVKFVMNFYNGPDNDVVNVYIDGNLVKTGTSWEDYYRFDTESNPGLAQNDSRTVRTMLFRESGTADPSNSSKGYLIDNLSMLSGAIPPNLPTTKDQCMNGGWRNYLVFKNQGDCVSFVATKGKNKPSLTLPQVTSHSATGTVILAGPTQTLTLNTYDNGVSANDTGYITYSNPSASLTYTTPPTCVNVTGNTAYVTYVIPSGNPFSGTWVVWKVVDTGSSDSAGFTTAPDMSTANSLCETGTASVTNYTVTSGHIVVL